MLRHRPGENERRTVELIRRREEGGMDALLLYYAPLIRYIAEPIAGEAEAEDCVHDTALRCWERIDSFDEKKGSFKAWLTAIARNAALDRVRKQKRTEAGELDEGIPDATPSAEELIIKKERKQALIKALDQLSIRERELFYRKYYYMQSTAQIASELGTTERAVEGKLYRIKKKLAARLEDIRQP